MSSTNDPSPRKMGQSVNRDKNIGTARVWLNRYLMNGSDVPEFFTNTNYPSLLSSLTEEHVEGDNLCIFMEAAGIWLASNEFSTRQGSCLLSTCKKEFFKNWVAVLKIAFPRHPMLQGTTNEWFPDMLRRFMKHCSRSRQDNIAIAEDRKSEPLYRNVSLDKSAIRAKYHGVYQVHCELTNIYKSCLL
jgi:hypothetical protein